MNDSEIINKIAFDAVAEKVIEDKTKECKNFIYARF